jgi:ABC-type Na+ efflux pump permease subunit
VRTSTVVGRIAAIVALGVAAVAVGLLLLGGGDDYTVTSSRTPASS